MDFEYITFESKHYDTSRDLRNDKCSKNKIDSSEAAHSSLRRGRGVGGNEKSVTKGEDAADAEIGHENKECLNVKTKLKDEKLYAPDDRTQERNKSPLTQMLCDSLKKFAINFPIYGDITVQVSGKNVPKPILRFRDARLSDFLCTNIENLGYKQPTPIQKAAIPIIMAKRDLMACAQTGSGKTAAFIIPILNTLLCEEKQLTIGKPQVVILSPTIEMSSEIYDELCELGSGSPLKFAIKSGWYGSIDETACFAKGYHVLVITPNRLTQFRYHRQFGAASAHCIQPCAFVVPPVVEKTTTVPKSLTPKAKIQPASAGNSTISTPTKKIPSAVVRIEKQTTSENTSANEVKNKGTDADWNELIKRV